MKQTFAALSSKGGVGKTTLLANIGGLLAEMGGRVLLVDADIQPSLTKYYDRTYEAPHGLVEVITQGTVTPQCVSRTSIPNLDLIKSNDGHGELQHWLYTRPDRRTRFSSALRNPYVEEHYDYILIDTQGAIGTLQTAAAFAADTLISPLPTDTPSVREFRTGTLSALQRLADDKLEPRADLAPIRAVICKYDHTRDARTLLGSLASEFTVDDRVSFMQTLIPFAVAYKDAFTLRRPVHTLSRVAGQRNASGFEVMHRLVWELIPELYGTFAGRMRGDPDEVFGARAEGGAS